MEAGKRMNIRQVMGSGEEGGLETHFVALCNGLVEAGDAVTVNAGGVVWDGTRLAAA